jgi:hypothetical protein
MNSAYNFNLFIKGTFSGSLECPLHIQVCLYLKDLINVGILYYVIIKKGYGYK